MTLSEYILCVVCCISLTMLILLMRGICNMFKVRRDSEPHWKPIDDIHKAGDFIDNIIDFLTIIVLIAGMVISTVKFFKD